jgi:hypothetical protein
MRRTFGDERVNWHLVAIGIVIGAALVIAPSATVLLAMFVAAWLGGF